MAIDPTKFLIGVYDIYQGCTKPADGQAAVLTAGIPAGGSLIGITDGEVGLKITPSITEIKGVQAVGILNIYQSDVETELTFNLKQVKDRALLDKVLVDASLFTDADPVQNLLGFGGINEIPAAKRSCWAAVTKLPYEASTLYFYIMLFEAFASSGIDLSISKEKESIVPVTLKPITQTAYTAGRQIGILGWETA